MTKSRAMNRRTFVRSMAAVAVAVPAVVRADALAASEKIAMASIGIGGQGGGHLNAMLGHPGVRVLAVCEVSDAKRRQAKKAVDERYGYPNSIP